MKLGVFYYVPVSHPGRDHSEGVRVGGKRNPQQRQDIWVGKTLPGYGFPAKLLFVAWVMARNKMNKEIKHLENPVGCVSRPKSKVFYGHMTSKVHSFADICESAVTVKDAEI